MDSYGLRIKQGEQIYHTNVETGTALPKDYTTEGQLVFRKDQNKLYIRGGGNMHWHVVNTGVEDLDMYLNDLIDVDAVLPLNDEALTFNGFTGMWEAKSTVRNIDDLDDVNAAAPTHKQVLVFDGISKSWIPETSVFGAQFLYELIDVDVPVPGSSPIAADGEVLTWNATTQTWESRLPLTAVYWVDGNMGNPYTVPPTASGLNSFAAGHSSVASESSSVAIGGNVTARENSVAMGILAEAGQTGVPSGAVAIGIRAKATYATSIAVGYLAETSGDEAIAFGYNSSASEDSIAMGRDASTSGLRAIAIGRHTTAASLTDALTARGSICISTQPGGATKANSGDGEILILTGESTGTDGAGLRVLPTGTLQVSGDAGTSWANIPTTIPSVTDNLDGTYEHNDGTGVTVTIDTRASSNPYDPTSLGMSPGLTATTVEGAINELFTVIDDEADKFSVLTDNADGTFTHDDGHGVTITFDSKTPAGDSTYDNSLISPGLTAANVQDAIDELAQRGDENSVSILTDNTDGTYTHDDGEGNVATIDTTAASNPYVNTNVSPGLTGTNVQDAIDELAARQDETTTSIVTNNANGTFTHDDGDGSTITVDMKTPATDSVYDNTTVSPGLLSTDVQGAIDELIFRIGGPLAPNAELVDNADGTYTFTDALGAQTDIDTNASTNPYDNSLISPGLSATDVQGAIDELAQRIDVDTDSISTLTDNGDGTFDHDDGQGNITSFDANTAAEDSSYDNTNISPALTATNVQDAIDELAALTDEDTVSVVTDNADGTYTHDDGTGTTVTIDTNKSYIDLTDTPAAYAGASMVVRTNATNDGLEFFTPVLADASDVVAPTVAEDGKMLIWSQVGNGWVYQTPFEETDANGLYLKLTGGTMGGNIDMGNNKIVALPIPTNAGDAASKAYVDQMDVVDNTDGTYKITEPDSTVTTINTNKAINDLTNVEAPIPNNGDLLVWDSTDNRWENVDPGTVGNTSRVTDNTDGTYTHDDGTGTTVTINTLTPATDSVYDNTNVTPPLVATNVQAAIDELASLTDDDTISVVADNTDGTYTHDDGTGTTVTIDTKAATNPVVPSGNITATNTQAALYELDVLKVNKSGDSMSGDLIMGANHVVMDDAPTTDKQATNKKYVDDMFSLQRLDDHLDVNVGGASDGQVLSYNNTAGQWQPSFTLTQPTADARYLRLSGTTPMAGNINMGGFNTIENLPNPLNASQAANKGYVDLFKVDEALGVYTITEPSGEKHVIDTTISGISLNDIDDVSADNPNVNDGIIWSGTEWLSIPVLPHTMAASDYVGGANINLNAENHISPDSMVGDKVRFLRLIHDMAHFTTVLEERIEALEARILFLEEQG